MNITMGGKYAYRRDPRKQVRVLCVDAPGPWAVVTIDPRGGAIRTHDVNGAYLPGLNENEQDLVPIDESLIVTPGVYRTQSGARVTICYIRSGAGQGMSAAIGWLESSGNVSTWKLDGQFPRSGTHRLDLVERIGDLP